MKICLKYSVLALSVLLGSLSAVSFYGYHYVSNNVKCGDSEFDCDKVDSAQAINKFWVGVASAVLSIGCFVGFYKIDRGNSEPQLDEEEGGHMVNGWTDARNFA